MDGFDVNEFIKYVGALIATVDPIGGIPLMLTLTPGYTTSQRFWVAVVASFTVFVTLVVSSWLGEEILAFFAISVELFRVAGGLLILLVAIDLLRGRHSSADTTQATGHNPAVVPLGIPLLAGPGAIATAIIFANHPHPTWGEMEAHGAAIAIATLATLGCLLAAVPLQRILGPTGMRIAPQIMGLLLAAVGIEMIAQGIWDHIGIRGLLDDSTVPVGE